MAMDYTQTTWMRINYVTEMISVHFQNGRGTHGGCLSIHNRKVKMAGCSFSFCSAQGSGGAVAVSGESTLITKYTVFVNNTATVIGDDCTALEAVSEIIGGGGIAGASPPQSCPGKSPYQTSPIISIFNSEFHHCSSYCGKGGSMYHKQVLLTVKNSNFSRSTSRSGGAIFLSKSSSSFSNSRFYRNHADLNGGALEILGTSTSIEHCEFVKNTALVSGGGMFFVFSELILIENLISENQAKSGGGVSMGFSCTLQSSENILRGNQATEDGGALVLVEVSEWNSHKDIFISNSGENGGCIYIQNPLNNKLHMNSVTLQSCYAKVSGGGVFFATRGRKFELIASMVVAEQNTAVGGGGGVFFWKKFRRHMHFDMIPGVSASFALSTGNQAKVGNIIASGPCKFIQWSGVRYTKADSIDRSKISNGLKMNREEARISDPSLFQDHVVAGKNVALKVAVLDYYGNHMKMKLSINKLTIMEYPSVWEEPIWHYGTDLDIPKVVGIREAGITNGVATFQRARIAARPGGIYNITVVNVPMGLKNKIIIPIKLRYCTFGEYLSTLSTPFCIACPPGQFSNVNGSVVPMQCQKCSTGQYQPNELSSACIACDIGTYRNFEGSQNKCVRVVCCSVVVVVVVCCSVVVVVVVVVDDDDTL